MKHLLMIWVCLLVLPSHTEAREAKEHDKDVEYDESRLPRYDLPPLLVSSTGEAITTPEAWYQKRRPEILSMFANLVYGSVPRPAQPVDVRFEVVKTDPNFMSSTPHQESPVWQVTLRVPKCLEEPATELLAQLLEQPVSAYCPLEEEDALVSAFITDCSSWDRQKAATIKEQLRTFFPELLQQHPLGVSCRKIKSSDWQESWKRHFKPLEIGNRLLIKPSWNQRKPKRNQACIILDPGLSFGTGQHATTRFCLEEIERLQQSDAPQSLLDIGTGSGILAIAGAKLGFQKIKAFDYDPEAVRVARENAASNDVADNIQMSRSDLTRLKPESRTRYSIVCANLTHDLLKTYATTILSRVQAQGYLLLAGILKEQFPAVEARFQALGCRLINSQVEKEWKSGSFCCDGPPR